MRRFLATYVLWRSMTGTDATRWRRHPRTIRFRSNACTPALIYGPSGNRLPQSKIYGNTLRHSGQAMVMYGWLVGHSERLPVKSRRLMGIVIEPKLGRHPLCRSPEKRAEVWASDRFQDPLGRRAGPARRSRGSRRCTFPRCPRACAKKC